MVEINKLLQDLDPMGSPHLEKELIGGDCRSRSPLPKPSKRCKNHRREGGGSKLKRFNNGGQFRGQEHPKTLGEEPPFIVESKYGRWKKYVRTRLKVRLDRLQNRTVRFLDRKTELKTGIRVSTQSRIDSV